MIVQTTPKFLVCKYVENIRRQETRNVGVILVHNNTIHARFLGEDFPGEIDGRRIKTVVDDYQTYAQWVNYWRYCIDPINVSSSDQVSDQEVERAITQLIESERQNFFISKGGEVLIPNSEHKDASALLTYLYNEVVEPEDEPATEAKIKLRKATDIIVEEAGIKSLPLYSENPKIEILNTRGKRERVYPDYLFINNFYNVLENVSLHASSEKIAQRMVDATQFMYERLEKHATKENNREAKFASFIDARPSQYTYDISYFVDILSGYGPIVDVSQPQQSKKVLLALAANH